MPALAFAARTFSDGHFPTYGWPGNCSINAYQAGETTPPAGQESLETAAAGGQVAPHLQTDGEEDQVFSGTSHIPTSPGAVLCKLTATGSAVPDSTSNSPG